MYSHKCTHTSARLTHTPINWHWKPSRKLAQAMTKLLTAKVAKPNLVCWHAKPPLDNSYRSPISKPKKQTEDLLDEAFVKNADAHQVFVRNADAPQNRSWSTHLQLAFSHITPYTSPLPATWCRVGGRKNYKSVEHINFQ